MEYWCIIRIDSLIDLMYNSVICSGISSIKLSIRRHLEFGSLLVSLFSKKEYKTRHYVINSKMIPILITLFGILGKKC